MSNGTGDKNKNETGDKKWKEGLATIGGGFALIAAILAAVGTASAGGLSRLFRNFGSQPAIALVILVGVIVAAQLISVQAGGPRLEGLWTRVGKWTYLVLGVVFLGATLWLVQMAVSSPGGRERPAISASVSRTDTGHQVEFAVTATGLKSEEYVYVVARGFAGAPTTEEQRTDTLLLQTHSGPDGGGTVDLPFKVTLPPTGIASVAIYARVWDTDAEQEFYEANRQLGKECLPAISQARQGQDTTTKGQENQENEEELSAPKDTGCLLITVPSTTP